jgi:hypothetical protein
MWLTMEILFMDPMKSAGIYLQMYLRLYVDVADTVGIPTRERSRDVQTITSRFANEGLPFLTVKLPALGKCLDEALAKETPLATPWFRIKEGCPVLFGALWRRVFSSVGGLLSEADPDCVKGLRQLLYFLYKLEVAYTEDLSKRTIDKFVTVDQDLPTVKAGMSDTKDVTIINYARIIVHRCLSQLDWREVIPRHGQGAVSTGERVTGKSAFKRFYPALHAQFPYDQYFVSGFCALAHDPKQIDRLVESEPIAKVVLVPKDSRGPRIISCEPLEIQWIQQGLMQSIVARIESHGFTKGYVNFTDQTVNQTLAMDNSRDGVLGTFDMKDASDRVSLDLVKELFGSLDLVDALIASRSTKTRLPDGTVMTLKKFAPMGSAVCFPVEALCFFALATAARYVKHEKNWLKFIPARAEQYRPYVYGDDLVFSIEDYDAVNSVFEKVGLAFNSSKCCVGTSFRESCGVDAFRGVNVTPLRCKALWSDTAPKSLLSYVALGNSSYERGFTCLADWIQQKVESHYGKLPHVETAYATIPISMGGTGKRERITAPAFGWIRDTCVHEANKGLRKRSSRNLQKSLVLSYVFKPLKQVSKIDGWREVLRNMHGTKRDCTGSYAVRRRYKVDRRWTAYSL